MSSHHVPVKLDLEPYLSPQGLAGGELTEPEGGEGAVWEDSMDDLAMAAEDMELRCVLAVVRHGDRTPKQKMKMVVNQARCRQKRSTVVTVRFADC